MEVLTVLQSLMVTDSQQTDAIVLTFNACALHRLFAIGWEASERNHSATCSPTGCL